MRTGDDPFGVLIIDHDPQTRRSLEVVLVSMGGCVLSADNEDQGLSILQKEVVEVVLVELPLSKPTDTDLLSRIARQNPSAAVIVLTDVVSIETAIEAMKKGASEFLPKPVDPDRLRAAVREALLKARKQKKAAAFFDDVDPERFGVIADSLPYGLLVINAACRAIFFNSAFVQLLGLAEDIPIGLPLAAYVQDGRLNHLVQQMAAGAPVDAKENVTIDLCLGNGLVLSARVRRLPAKKEQDPGAIVTLMDVTATKVLDRLKSDFVAKVSHELRSPLSTIHEQLAVVLSDMAGGLPASDQHLLSRAKEKTQGLIDLIGDLLDLSRIEAGATVCEAPKAVDVIDLLEKIIDFLHTRAAAKHQTLTLSRSKQPVPGVEADPLALESIFGNLITNAINYTPDGGQIQVQAERDGAHLRIQVRDTGFGIEPQHLEKIFERFYRVKNDQTRYITGTGLGLPIVKGLVESLGGQITVESRPVQGSIFTVRLPVVH